jgi:toxin FitB
VNSFLLDTNVLSELTRLRPDPLVEAWVYGQDENRLYISAVSIGELRRGIVILPECRRRQELEQWLEQDLLPRFDRRILSIDRAAADRWGILDGACRIKGRPISTADGMIAATALEHDLTVATRNIKHFAGVGVRILNPWEPA